MRNQDAISRCYQFGARQRNAGGGFSAPETGGFTGEDGVTDQLETFLTADRARGAGIEEEPLLFRIGAHSHVTSPVMNERLFLFVLIGQRIQCLVLRAFHVSKGRHWWFFTPGWFLKAGALVTLQVKLVAAGTEEGAPGVDAIVSAASVIVPTLVNIRTLTVILFANFETWLTRAAVRAGFVGANVGAIVTSLAAFVDIDAEVTLSDVAFITFAAE